MPNLKILAERKQSGPTGPIWFPIARLTPIGNANLAKMCLPDWRPIWHFFQSGFEHNLAFGFFPDWSSFPIGLFFLIAPISSEVFKGIAAICPISHFTRLDFLGPFANLDKSLLLVSCARLDKFPIVSDFTSNARLARMPDCARLALPDWCPIALARPVLA